MTTSPKLMAVPLKPPEIPMAFNQPKERPYTGFSRLKQSATQPMGDLDEPEEKVDERITNTFWGLGVTLQDFINDRTKSLMIISGAGGAGKTKLARENLEKAEREGIIEVNWFNTTSSAINLYQIMYENRKPNQVLVLDDSDNWRDIRFLNLLKSGHDSYDIRTVHWGTETAILANADIPYEFDYYGRMLIITNEDVTGYLEKATRESKHIDAVLRRALYFDMGIHTRIEVLVRIRQIFHDTTFLELNDLTKEHGDMILAWLRENIARLRKISMGTCLDLGPLIKHHPEDWKRLAELILIQRS